MLFSEHLGPGPLQPNRLPNDKMESPGVFLPINGKAFRKRPFDYPLHFVKGHVNANDTFHAAVLDQSEV